MGKSVILFSFISIAVLLVGCMVAPTSAAFWLANSSDHFTIIRLILLGALGALLVTNPPRNFVLRVAIGSIATGLGLWCIGQTYQNHMQLLDTLTILAACVSSGIAVLEYIPEEAEETVIDEAPAKSKRSHGKRTVHA